MCYLSHFPEKTKEDTGKVFALWHSTFFPKTVHMILAQEEVRGGGGGGRGEGMTSGCPNYLAHLYLCQKSLLYSRQDSRTRVSMSCIPNCKSSTTPTPLFLMHQWICVFSLSFPLLLIFVTINGKKCLGLVETVSVDFWLFYSMSKHTMTYS